MNNIVSNSDVDGVHMHLENRKMSRQFFWFIWIAYSCIYMTKSCFSAALAAIVAEGVLTKSQTGLITAMFYLTYGPLQILGGFFADKYNPERMIKIGLLGGALANTIIFFNQNYYVMLATWLFNGAVQFALWPSIFKIISSQLVRSDRKMMVNYITFASSFGLLLAYLVAAFVTKWQYNFAISAIVLVVLAVILHIFYGRVEPYMKPDKDVPEVVSSVKDKESPHSTFKLFLASGFFAMVAATLFVTMAEQGFKTLSPTMLLESYSNISPRIGNLLGTLVIISGMLGIIVVAMFLYPKVIKNELWGYVLMLAISLPCVGVLRFVGQIDSMVSVALMCVAVFCLAPTFTFSSQYNMRFVKFGKNGTAAGISNAAMSLAIVLESYGFTLLAEKFDWSLIMTLCIGFIIGSLAFAFGAMLLWKKFNKKLEN